MMCKQAHFYYFLVHFFQMIRFFMSSNLVVSGIRIQNSPQFHMKFDGCEGVLIEKLSISTPKLSPNTDGIHIENTKSVGIYNSMISNGDDCISIGPGCSNVDIEGVTCGPSHGMSIGSLGVHNSRACVSNIIVHTVLSHVENLVTSVTKGSFNPFFEGKNHKKKKKGIKKAKSGLPS